MKVDSLRLQQFTVFEDVELAFSPGINVFLGTNGTGKSHAMKALYAPLKAVEDAAPDEVSPHAYTMKLRKVFKPDREDLDRLVRRGAGDRRAKIDLGVDGARIGMTLGGFESGEHLGTRPAKALFLPSRELLSMFDGFLAAYKGRELSFDETYYDACFSLSAKELKGERYEETAPLRAPIEAAIGGRVVLEGTRFVIRRPDGDMEPHLLAEGWRKLASVAHLIANGSLSPGTAFFWDEPEAGLNPQMITIVVDLLLGLAERGVQIFVATHDYLLSHTLSSISDYKKRPGAPTRFFLFRRRDGAVTVEHGDTLADLPEDPINDAFLRNYDFERELFYGPEGPA
jgi:energy-coupling factor transporter ATP-binding protein EcfA2